MTTRGVVAAGHPVTAEAGAWALREGGNAVDAAVAAVLTSFAAESPLTGFGAGGYMLVHSEEGTTLFDFFVEAPGRGGRERGSELVPVPVRFTEEATQVFNVGAASCGVPGLPAGLQTALAEAGSMPMSALAERAARSAREGVAVSKMQAYLFSILDGILLHMPEGRAIYAPAGHTLTEGELFRWPELADALERYGAEGSEPFYRGDVARQVSDWVVERGGTLGAEDMAAYETIRREPVRARFAGREVLTNPPPSSGGILIAFALELLERLGSSEVADVVGVMAEAQAERGSDFANGLLAEGFAAGFLDPGRLDEAAVRAAEHMREGPGPAGRLGSTTHLTAVDGDGRCATVTCSNGTGSGMIVPGTGVHVNNMLGEEDLNPLGFHLAKPGTRLPSMMSPTLILRDGELEAGLGSAGSNRIRSAVLQVILRLVADGAGVEAAVEAPRVHFEAGELHAEPGVDPQVLDRIEANGLAVERWHEANLFFGGVQAVALDAATGEWRGAGDPRRGGAVAYA